jgi:Rrf2 family protein
MARHTAEANGREWITIKEIAEKERYPVAYIEKILQQLRQANLVISHHGNQGGYSLARKPADITVKQVIDVLEGGTFEIFCEPEVREEIVCTHFCMCGVKPIWRKTKELLDRYYDSITLEMVANNQEAEIVR